MILVTGGAGYIGSHTCVELLQAGHGVVVVDNLCNSHHGALRRVELITSCPITFHHADISDRESMRRLFRMHQIDTVIHFAGLKAVGESVTQPLQYYETNVSGTIALLEVMSEFGVRKIAFSSSATVYHHPASSPIMEDAPTAPANPYGRSKLMVERILRDLVASNPEWRVALLRYFNPVGAHPSSLIGEDPTGTPNNLLPFIAQVAMGRLPMLQIFGNDYATKDGTGVRDYIHIVDLARGHLAAYNWLHTHGGIITVNFGAGKGYSVLEMVSAFSKASGRHIPHSFLPRRPGDIDAYWADTSLAKQIFGWSASHGIAEMCKDTWQWQRNNPSGYDGC